MRQLLVATLSLGMIACTSTQNHPSVVDGTTCPVQQGTVLDVQSVTIERNTHTAPAVGAGLGAYIANRATKNSDEVTSTLVTITAAAAGAAVGNAAAQDLRGVELVVQLNSGTLSIIQQRTQYNFQLGDAVWVVGYPFGGVYTRTNCRGLDIRVFPITGKK